MDGTALRTLKVTLSPNVVFVSSMAFPFMIQLLVEGKSMVPEVLSDKINVIDILARVDLTME